MCHGGEALLDGRGAQKLHRQSGGRPARREMGIIPAYGTACNDVVSLVRTISKVLDLGTPSSPTAGP